MRLVKHNTVTTFSLYIIPLIFLFLMSCSNKSKEIQEYNFDNLITNVNTEIIPDTLQLLAMPVDMEIYKDSLVIFADFASRQIYKYDIINKTIKVLGKKGKGPGEYLDVTGLYVEKNKIYYSDNSEPGIECFNFNGSDAYRLNNDKLNRVAPPVFFKHQDSVFYYLSEFTQKGYFLHSSEGKALLKAKDFFVKNMIYMPFSGIYLDGDKLFFMRLFEKTIYSVNLKSGVVDNKLINQEGFYNWNNPGTEKFDNDKMMEIYNKYYRLSGFLGIKHKNKNYFMVSIFNEKKGDKILVCNSSGEVLFIIKNKNPFKIHQISSDKCYGYGRNEKGLFLKTFNLNDKFFELL